MKSTVFVQNVGWKNTTSSKTFVQSTNKGRVALKKEQMTGINIFLQVIKHR
jgi:hypothetical protein